MQLKSHSQRTYQHTTPYIRDHTHSTYTPNTFGNVTALIVPEKPPRKTFPVGAVEGTFEWHEAQQQALEVV